MTTPQPISLDWLIVGGGIHGTAVSLYLARQKRVNRERLRVLDPHPRPLARWDTNTANVGMTHLRSPHVQSLDTDPWSISTFAKTRRGAPVAEFIPTHNRPSLALFRAHADWIRERHNLDALRIQGRATGLRRTADGWQVETTIGLIDAQNVVLAFGAGEQPRWPDWAAALRPQNAPVNHVFEAGFDREALPDWSQAVVIGGGISAAQLALALALRQPGTVTLLMRRPLRVAPFDSDLGWVGGTDLQRFRAEPDYARRREIIRAARYTGTVPEDVALLLQQAEARGVLRVQVGEVASAAASTSGVTLTLTDGSSQTTDRLLLATGFDSRRPGGPWLDEAVTTLQLPVNVCGYPVVGPDLAWAHGLFVTGPLAELYIGPVSRNIIGARLAAEAIVRALQP
jgi:cation diffusion facilitator CzcD-associated flavoprotein CzcO